MEPDTIDMFSEISASFRAALQRTAVLKELSLPAYQARLITLALRNPGLSQQKLADITERDKAQVARSLRELDDRGLITRKPHPSNARAIGVWVTDAGFSMATRLLAERQKLAIKLLAVLSEQEKRALESALSRFRTALKDEADGGERSL